MKSIIRAFLAPSIAAAIWIGAFSLAQSNLNDTPESLTSTATSLFAFGQIPTFLLDASPGRDEPLRSLPDAALAAGTSALASAAYSIPESATSSRGLPPGSRNALNGVDARGYAKPLSHTAGAWMSMLVNLRTRTFVARPEDGIV
jgi:hypothetical protein